LPIYRTSQFALPRFPFEALCLAAQLDAYGTVWCGAGQSRQAAR